MAAILAFQAVQHGLDERDDVAFVKAGQRWVRVPLWLWQAQREGGYYELLTAYGLHWYPAPEVEAAALADLELEARALLRFMRRGGDQHYYNLMKTEHRDVLAWERAQLQERGSLYGREKWAWITERMKRKYEGITADVVAWLWNEAVDMLKIDQQRRDVRRFDDMARMLRDLNTANDATWDGETIIAA